MHSSDSRHISDDLDFSLLLKGVLAGWKWVLALPLAAGLVALGYLSSVDPIYVAETRILLDNDRSVFRRPVDTNAETRDADRIDKEAIASQVEVLYSADLAALVARRLGLARNPEFNTALQPMGPVKMFAAQLGLVANPFKMSERERVLRSFRNGLTVYPVGDSRSIAIEFESTSPDLAAAVANALGEAYLQWKRNERLARTKSATDWLDTQIAQLRKNVAEAEARVGAYRAKTGLYSGSNNTELSAQQLSELNSRLILAKAARTEAEARAQLIRKILNSNGNIDSASDVLKSPLIQRLLEQRVALQRRIAQISATHLRSHPRMKRLNAELYGLRSQIRQEARKIVSSLENEAEIAGAREKSLTKSLASLTKTNGGQSAENIRLREMERDAKASREVLNTFLSRQRDARARHDLSAVSPGATIYERAFASTVPAFPKTLPILVLTVLATLMLTVFAIVTKILINGEASRGANTAQPAAHAAPRKRQPRQAFDPAQDNADSIAPSAPSAVTPGRKVPLPEGKQTEYMRSTRNAVFTERQRRFSENPEKMRPRPEIRASVKPELEGRAAAQTVAPQEGPPKRRAGDTNDILPN